MFSVDHTRVKLLQKTDDDSDFINANYLPVSSSLPDHPPPPTPNHTRVKLLWKTDDDLDFINANYLPVSNSLPAHTPTYP